MKKILTAVFISLISLHLQAQDSGAIPDNAGQPPRPKFSSRLFGGGDLALQFGTYTLVNVAPLVGYKLTDKLGAGVGPIFSYVKDNTYKPAYESSAYGGRLFGQYAVTTNILAYSEYQVVNTDVIDDFTYQIVRRSIPFWFAGGAYVAPMGQRSGLMIMVLFDLMDDPYSYYSNPVFRVGFTTGF